MSVACIIIAGGKRTALIDEQIVQSIEGFDEVVVVGEHHDGTGYRYLHVPGLCNDTRDALVKRDVGTLTTESDWLFYLSDDHAVTARGREPLDKTIILVPHRRCGGIRLNMGLALNDPNRPYVGGHAGLFHRSLIQRHPWTTMPHDRLWDLLSSRILVKEGATLVESPDWVIEDLTPETEPWR